MSKSIICVNHSIKILIVKARRYHNGIVLKLVVSLLFLSGVCLRNMKNGHDLMENSS